VRPNVTPIGSESANFIVANKFGLCEQSPITGRRTMSLKTETTAQKTAAFERALRDLKAGVEAQRQMILGAR